MTESPVFRPATLDDYLQWLRRWLDEGQKPTSYYDYPFGGQSWLYALRDFMMGGECGDDAVHIIVATEVRHADGKIGQNHLYLMNGPKVAGGLVPVYSDPEFAEIEELNPFIRRGKAQLRIKGYTDQESWNAACSDIGQFLGRQP